MTTHPVSPRKPPGAQEPSPPPIGATLLPPRTGRNMLPVIVLGLCLLGWAIVWPAVPLDDEAVLTLNGLLGGAGLWLVALGYALHAP